MRSWIFSIITPVFSVLHKSFWYADLLLKKNVLLIEVLKTVVLNIFVEPWYTSFSMFTLTFEQFNVSLLSQKVKKGSFLYIFTKVL